MYRFSLVSWYLGLPVVVLLGDAILKPHFTFDLTAVLTALALGLVVGIVEEYIFRGLLVNYLTEQFQLGAGMTAALSGFIFAMMD